MTLAGRLREKGEAERHMWDKVQAAHAWWTEQGRPDKQDWVFTVHPDRQTITLPAEPAE